MEPGHPVRNLSKRLWVMAAVVCCSIHVSALAQGNSPIRKDVEQLRSEVTNVGKAQAATADDVKKIKEKMDETGWKALDFASQVASAQWTMFGTGLAVLGFVFAVVGVAAYQMIMRRMRFRLNAAATRLEARLTKNIENEELRLQQEMNKRGEAVKQMMESTRFAVQARLFGAVAHVFWEQHSKNEGASQAELEEKRRNLETSIHLARRGVEITHGVVVDSAEDRNLLTALQAANAYYLAEFWRFAAANAQFSPLLKDEEKREALNLASVAQKSAQRSLAANSDPLAREHIESACWVFWNLGAEAEKRRAMETLREVYELDSSDNAMRDWIRQRYFENKEPTWSE